MAATATSAVSPAAALGWVRPPQEFVVGENLEVPISRMVLDQGCQHGQIWPLDEGVVQGRMAALAASPPLEPVSTILVQADAAGVILPFGARVRARFSLLHR